MSEAELKAIEERVAATTPGPWQPLDRGYRDRAWRFADGEFITHARQDILALLAYIRELEGIIHDQREESGAYQQGLKDGERAAAVKLKRPEFSMAEFQLDKVTADMLFSPKITRQPPLFSPEGSIAGIPRSESPASEETSR